MGQLQVSIFDLQAFDLSAHGKVISPSPVMSLTFEHVGWIDLKLVLPQNPTMNHHCSIRVLMTIKLTYFIFQWQNPRAVCWINLICCLNHVPFTLLLPSRDLIQLWKLTMLHRQIMQTWAIFHSYVKLPESIPSCITIKSPLNHR